MQIIINILAGIGALTVLSIAWVIVIIAMDAHREKKKEKEETKEKQPICALTDEKLYFCNGKGNLHRLSDSRGGGETWVQIE